MIKLNESKIHKVVIAMIYAFYNFIVKRKRKRYQK